MNNIAFWSSTPQQGKSTAAEFLQVQYGYQRLSFAEPLRSMIGAMLSSAGLTYDKAFFYMNEGKELDLPVIGKSFRYLARTLGTEWGRELVHSDIWVKIAEERLIEQLSKGAVCVDDMRFWNEFDLLCGYEFKFVKIIREVEREDSHSSDAALRGFEDWDHVICNDGTMEDLYRKIEAIL